jgi:serine/threonine protein kinase
LRLELEYVGQDLSKFVDAQHMSHLSEDTAYQIWQDVSNRLKYIHRKGVIHLDIKPQNILLDKGGQAKICDFGSSVCAVVPVPYNGGTSHYTPPEYILSGERGPAGDIWGLGITMGFVLGLEPLPRGRGWTIAKVGKDGEATRKMYQWLDHVKRRIKETPDRFSLLRKMLLVDPGYRITSSELVNSLRTIPRIKALMGLVV